MTRHRIARLRNVLKERNLGALIVSSLPNIRYLTNFSGSSALCIVTQTKVQFLSDTRYSLQSKTEVGGARRLITTRGLFEEAAHHRLLNKCKRVGFESHHTTYAQYRLLKKLFASTAFVPTHDIVESLVQVKDAEELTRIRKAVSISDSVFSDILPMLRPGVQEREVAAEISYLHKRNGADQDAFEPIVASGVRGALPHAGATEKRIKRGEMVTLDFGCTVAGYNSDITRTMAIGKTPRRAREIYDVVLNAQLEAIAFAKAQISARDLDNVARKRIKAEGYGRYFTHSLGHGLGLQVHELPRISWLNKESLLAGSVVTIEPGIYIPGFGGVRIEDDVVLSAGGCEVLNTAPKEFMTI